jgi:prepilin-type N-terminal cleavage/methylation domain-containing protein|tara:strand:- start:5029 stop:5556 length:528 start_codon:yes stop_codon:yes gene_type:complete
MIRKKQSGFSIIELLVVMFIIVTIASLMLANHRLGQKKYALSQSAQRLASDFRRAQNMALSGVDVFSSQYYGYGVYLGKNDDFYILYGDENNNDKYDGGDTIIETIYFPSQVEIQSLAPPPTSKKDMFFKSPDAATFIDGAGIVGGSATIILQIKGDSSSIKTITITTAGLIQID